MRIISSIVNFDNLDIFKEQIKPVMKKWIGAGEEGACFLHEDYVYKLMKWVFGSTPPENTVDIDKIITMQDICLDSFLFPNELYVVNGFLAGNKTNYFRNNLFTNNLNISLITDVDYTSMVDAYYKMVEDIKRLSNENILIEDLTFNLLFNNEKFVAVDTIYYKRCNYPVYLKNIHQFNFAIEMRFQFILDKFYKKKFMFSHNLMLEKIGIEGYCKEMTKQKEKIMNRKEQFN